MDIEDIKIIATLIKKRITNTMSPHEKTTLDKWLTNNHFATKYFSPDFIKSHNKIADIEAGLDAYERFIIKTKQRNKKRFVLRYSIAAALLFGLFTSTFFYLSSDTQPSTTISNNTIQKAKSDMTTTKGEIYLEMADGSVIKIEQKSGDIKVDKSSITIGEKKVEMTALSSTHTTYNKLRIMRGAEHTMTLEDGTKVWINAESEFYFPSQFNTSERRVKAKGEIYMEVAKDASRPFIIETANGNIEVLGTIFNLRCYQEQQMQTTLVEGRVKISSSDKNIIITPGQQCNVTDGKLVVKEVELEEYTAWTKGLFTYNNRNLATIMRDIERTYDVQIVFDDKTLQNVTLTGTFKRYGDINKVLEMLQQAGGFRYSYNGEQIIIHK